MQIVFHIGANCTDGERLLKSLLKNAETFAGQGIRVPGPGRFRRLLRETIQNLGGGAPAPETRDILLDAIIDDDAVTRVVMSHGAFLGVPNQIFADGRFYALAERKIGGLAALFPDDELELHLALRNIATFLPAVFEAARAEDFGMFMAGADPRSLRWSDLIARLQTAAPNARLTVWCNEDTPLIWAQLIRELSGVDPLAKITGGFDLLSEIMTKDGMKRFLTYLKSHPPQTETQKRRVIAAFLDKYAIPEEIEEELDLPGWDAALVAELSERYDEDVYRIEKMPGVSFIAP